MDRTTTAAAFLVALLPFTVLAENTEQQESPLQYFVGVKGGISKLGNSDRIIQSGGDRIDGEESEFEGFAGGDIGIYTPGGKSRIYYSYEQHWSEITFPDMPDYEVNADLHLLNADYLFRQYSSLNPFVGLHFGYAMVEPESDFSGTFDANGIVFGLQAGVSWTVVDQLGFELGFRHSLLPSDTKSWQGEDNNGNPVTIESQQKGVSSFYAGATYRF